MRPPPTAVAAIALASCQPDPSIHNVVGLNPGGLDSSWVSGQRIFLGNLVINAFPFRQLDRAIFEFVIKDEISGPIPEPVAHAAQSDWSSTTIRHSQDDIPLLIIKLKRARGLEGYPTDRESATISPGNI